MYSIDTSAILDGMRRHYPPDTFPGLWDRVSELVAAGGIKACEMVQVELEKRDDEALAWVKGHPDLISPLDEARQLVVRDILRQFPRLVDTRRGRSGADPFVISVAVQYQCPVITGEVRTGNLESPRIPDVCDALGLEWISFLEFIRRQGWVFR